MSDIVHVQRLDGSTHPVDIEMLPYVTLPSYEMSGSLTHQREVNRIRSEGTEHRKYKCGEMVFICKVTTVSFRQAETVGKTPKGLKILPGPSIGSEKNEYFAWEIETAPLPHDPKPAKKGRGRRDKPLTRAEQKAIEAHRDTGIPLGLIAVEHGLDPKELKKANGRLLKRERRADKKPVKPS